MDFFQILLKSFGPATEGYLFMWVILIFFVLMMATAIERIIFIWRSDINANRFMAEIRKLIIRGEFKKAMNLCKAGGDKALPQVILAILVEADRKEIVDSDAIQNAVNEATLEITPRLTKRTGYLAMIANVSTLLGLLGTIFGLIQTFNAVSFSSTGVSSNLAAKISIALIPMYWGLSTAIPAIILYAWISVKANNIIGDIDKYSVKLINLLTRK